jgi:ribulose-5-phosphate 4-epimerase/fuculose-1-phosphate aldolase
MDTLNPDAYEPTFADPGQLRAHRQRRLALAYRVFGALGWGALGDGHISARDPELVDSFWLGRYGVPFRYMTVDDLVLVGPDGSLTAGADPDRRGFINRAAYYIHGPVHELRPDVVSAAHCHTPYGTPLSAQVRRLEPVSQESCAFYNDHEVFDDHEVSIQSTDGGKRIGAALGDSRAIILRNHGLLTVGQTVDAAVGYFVMMERSAEVQVKAGVTAQRIDHDAAQRTHDEFDEVAAWQAFQWLVRTYVPDPSVID